MATKLLTTTEENINNLEKVITLIRRKNESKSKFQDAYTFDVNHLTNKTKIGTLGKRSITLINDCLGSHHFEEAAKLLWVLCQDRSYFHAFLYKSMMVVLENLQFDNKNETMLKFSSHIQDQESINKLDVQLEYMLYAIRNNIPELQDSYEKVTFKRRLCKLKRIPCLDYILNAYCSLLDYIAWRKSYQDDKMSALSKNLADKAISGMKSVLEHPGIWDIFVLKLIEMLEHYENYEEIEDILTKYVEHNPEHVNAYVYLCVHLYKVKSDKAFVQYSKKLCQLCPPDSRVLLLVQRWNEQGKKFKERLKILFKYLDYPANGKNKLGWKMLASHLSQAVKSEKYSAMEAAIFLWSFRAQAWNYMYFNSKNKDDLELVEYKVRVISILENGHPYINDANCILQSTSNLTNNHTSSHAEDLYEVYKLDDDIMY